MIYGEVHRFLVPLDSAAALRYYRAALYLPQTRRDRFTRSPRFRRSNSMAGTETLSALLDESVWRPKPASRAIYLRDTSNSGRGRSLAFFLTDDDSAPYAIAKAQDANGRGASLRPEAEALDRLQTLLPYASSLPRVIDFHASARGELLVTTGVRGHSNQIDLRRSLLPRRHVERHFDAAARWLARFHQSTQGSHGDFWPGNVLLDDDGSVSVVDWEHFTPGSSPSVDLFHYALTYGLHYPWHWYQPYDDPETAFRLTFLEQNHVSRAVVRYLKTYQSLTGVGGYLELFRRYLETRGAMGGLTRERSGTADLPWERFQKLFERAKATPLHDLGD